MIVMGTNTWEFDMPKDMLVERALEFADDVKAQGIAELLHFLMAHEQNILWCTWETNDLEALQEAFDDMNLESGLVSKLTIVEDMYPK